MSGSRFERLAAAGGAVSAVLLLAGLLLQAVAVGGAEDESRAEVVARYSDGGNELRAEAGALLVGLAVASLLPFLGSLRATLRPREGERATLPTAAFAGGVVLAVMLMASAASTAAAFSSYDFYEAYQVDPSAVLLMQTVSFSTLGFALVGGGVLVGATSLVALRARLLPRWLAVAGLPLSLLLLVGELALILFVPVPLLLLWTFGVSVLLVVRHGGRPANTADRVTGP